MQEQQPDAQIDRREPATPGSAAIAIQLAGATSAIAGLIYLGGGIIAPLKFAALLVGVIFPLAALVTKGKWTDDLSGGWRIVLGTVFAIVISWPLYYARRFVPISGAVLDGAVIVLATATALRTGAYRQWLGHFRTATVRAAAPWMLVALPVLFCTVWSGLGVVSGDRVTYRGLYGYDFAVLTSVVSLVSNSPGLPESFVAGTGSLQYHWPYFITPAWLGEFLGIAIRHSSALILCNFLVACLLFLSLCEAAARWMPRMTPSRHAALAAAVVMFAPTIMYEFHAVAPFLHLSWATTHPNRNWLLLSLVTLMIAFGNNTLAIVCAVLLLEIAELWNRRLHPAALVSAALLLMLIIPLSITLFLPVAGLMITELCLGRVRRPIRTATITAIVAAICAATLYEINVLGGSSPSTLSFAFDGGRFLLNAAFGMVPLWLLAGVAPQFGGAAGTTSWRFLGFCVLVPSIIYVRNSPAGHVAFSMKTSSLMMAAAIPLVALGLSAVLRRETPRWFGALLGIVLFGAVLNSGHDAGQFAFEDSSIALPLDYVRIMDWTRLHTPREAILIDPTSNAHPVANFSLALAERRTLLPKPFKWRSGNDDPGMLERRRKWRAWTNTGLRDPALSRQFAVAAGYLVVANFVPPAADWEELHREGRFVIFRSRHLPSS